VQSQSLSWGGACLEHELSHMAKRSGIRIEGHPSHPRLGNLLATNWEASASSEECQGLSCFPWLSRKGDRRAKETLISQ
jgi:hypothetical protein